MRGMKTFVIVGCLLAPLMAMAEGTTARLSWSHPATYTDGSPVAVSDIKETLIEWRRPGSESVVGSMRVAAPAVTATATVVCNDYVFSGYTIMKTNATSEESVRRSYSTNVACKPNPPTLGEVQ
jgi:hypothetical protein